MSYSKDFVDGLQKLRKNGIFCDVVLKSSTEESCKEFLCHKVVLSALSDVFEKMLDSSFKVCTPLTDCMKFSHFHL